LLNKIFIKLCQRSFSGCLPSGHKGYQAVALHFLISRSPKISEEVFATIVAESSANFIQSNKLCVGTFAWQQSASAFSVSKTDVDRICNTFLTNLNIIKK
jgi:putative transposase